MTPTIYIIALIIGLLQLVISALIRTIYNNQKDEKINVAKRLEILEKECVAKDDCKKQEDIHREAHREIKTSLCRKVDELKINFKDNTSDIKKYINERFDQDNREKKPKHEMYDEMRQDVKQIREGLPEILTEIKNIKRDHSDIKQCNVNIQNDIRGLSSRVREIEISAGITHNPAFGGSTRFPGDIKA
jgi:hypothetical protein